MSQDTKRAPEAPAQLRERASHFRWAALFVEAPERARELLDFADELEAEAGDLEAE